MVYMRYSFGTTHAAALRLETIAHFFNPVAEAFIREHVKTPVDIAVDLGCGPGFTTQLLMDALPGATLYGLDNSRAFLDLARERLPEARFMEHDVTRRPFPIRGNVLYARFLLSHLPDVVALVNGWTDELAPQGLLFVDELEAIDTEIPAFKRYLEINTRIVESTGADLFVGRKLAQGSYDRELLCNESVTLPVPNVKAATWFYPNTVTIWQTEEAARDGVSVAEKNAISKELLAMRDSQDRRQDITWHMRHLVIRRRN